MQNLTILGSTGSIGQSTLNVVRKNPQHFRIFALSAHQNATLLAQQIDEFSPKWAAISTPNLAQQVQQSIKKPNQTTILFGEESLVTLATHSQTHCVMAAIVGAAGLKPTLAAAQTGKTIFLANKEVLVMAGALFCQAVKQNGAVVLPVDSEHNAIFQSLPTGFRCCCDPFPAQKIVLTASGGAFLNKPMAELKHITPDEAKRHPNWKMGQKVTIDSASLMNKGLEVIEAFWLFSCLPQQIEVVIHPQSIVHSGVQYPDGALIAEMGQPNMQTPIAHALAQSLGQQIRIASGVPNLNLCQMPVLEFFPPDTTRFPNLALAFCALQKGESAPAILNAANEVAVAAFLEKRIAFTDIASVNRFVLENSPIRPADDLDALFQADSTARAKAEHYIDQQLTTVSQKKI